MNKIIVSGRLTKDGETRTTESGKSVYSGSVAVNRNFRNKEGNYDADFFNFVYWNVSDKFKDYLKKGKGVLIEGSLQTRTYEDKDKNKKHITEIIAERIELIGEGKKEQHDKPEGTEFDTLHTKTEYKQPEVQLEDADLPF